MARWSTRAAWSGGGGVPYACDRHMHPKPSGATWKGPRDRRGALVRVICVPDTPPILLRLARLFRAGEPGTAFGIQRLDHWPSEPGKVALHIEAQVRLQ